MNQGMQLVKFLEDGKKVEFNNETLEKAIHKVKDLPVAVISINGAYRQGKSFLLNFLLRYLRSKGESKWLDDKESEIEGFAWKFDCNRVTTGILLWPEAFVVNNIAVLLIDTQGTFDNVTTVQESTQIVAISALLSSLTIFNMSERIESKDLDNLSYFLQYGALAFQKTQQTQRQFQDSIFLIRDWKFAKKFAYGYDGGKKYLDDILESGKQKDSIREINDNLKASFDSTQCYLMPFPGGRVARDSNFKGKLSDINSDFLDQMKYLVESILAPNNIKAKCVGTHILRAKDLQGFLLSLTETFNNNTLPEASTLLQMFSETVARSVVDKLVDEYNAQMKEKEGTEQDLKSLHTQLQNLCIHKLNETIMLGGTSLITHSVNDVKQRTEQSYREYFQPLHEDRKRIEETKTKLDHEKITGQKYQQEKSKLENKVKDTEMESKRIEQEAKKLTQSLEITEKNKANILQQTEQVQMEIKQKSEHLAEERRRNEEYEKKCAEMELLKKANQEFFEKTQMLLVKWIDEKQTVPQHEVFLSLLKCCTPTNVTSTTNRNEILCQYEEVMDQYDHTDLRYLYLKNVKEYLTDTTVAQLDFNTPIFQRILQDIEEILSKFNELLH